MTADRMVVECGECEALRLLRVVVEGNAVQRGSGLDQTRRFLGRLPSARLSRAGRARWGLGKAVGARSFRECVASVESLRLLAMIMAGAGEERAEGLECARGYLNSLRLPEGVRVCGPKVRSLSARQLLWLAAVDAWGVSFARMAARVGCQRRLVHYHLRPSAAMLGAIVDAPLARVVDPFSVEESSRATRAMFREGIEEEVGR